MAHDGGIHSKVDELLAALAEAAAGEDNYDLIREQLDYQLAATRRELAEIPQRAQQRGSEFVAAAQQPMQRLLEEMKGYQDSLNSVQRAVLMKDPPQIAVGLDGMRDRAVSFLKAVDDYSEFYTSFGNSPVALVNMIRNLAQSIRSGAVPPEAWLAHLQEYYQIMMDQHRAISTRNIPGRTLAMEAYVEAMAALQSLAQTPPDQAPELEQGLLQLEEMMGYIEHLHAEQQAAQAGPTAMPAANVLIRAVQQMLVGEVDIEELETFVDDYRRDFDAFLENFERNSERDSGSAIIQDEVERTFTHLEDHEAAIDALLDALSEEPPNRAEAEAAIVAMTEAIGGLKKSSEVYSTVAQHAGKIMCVRCSRPNPQENRTCEACGAVLPRTGQASQLGSSTFDVREGPADEMSTQQQFSEAVARLFQACEDVREHRIELAEFEKVLVETSNRVTMYEEGMMDLGDDLEETSGLKGEQLNLWETQYRPHLVEIEAQILSAIDEWRVGLETLALYLNEQEEKHLTEGIRRIWEAEGVIHRAQLSLESVHRDVKASLSRNPGA